MRAEKKTEHLNKNKKQMIKHFAMTFGVNVWNTRKKKQQQMQKLKAKMLDCQRNIKRSQIQIHLRVRFLAHGINVY